MTLEDPDLNMDSKWIETVYVNVTSTTDPQGFLLLLEERVTRLENRTSAIENQLKSLTEQLQGLQATLNSQFATLTAKISDLGEKLQTNQQITYVAVGVGAATLVAFLIVRLRKATVTEIPAEETAPTPT